MTQRGRKRGAGAFPADAPVPAARPAHPRGPAAPARRPRHLEPGGARSAAGGGQDDGRAARPAGCDVARNAENRGAGAAAVGRPGGGAAHGAARGRGPRRDGRLPHPDGAARVGAHARGGRHGGHPHADAAGRPGFGGRGRAPLRRVPRAEPERRPRPRAGARRAGGPAPRPAHPRDVGHPRRRPAGRVARRARRDERRAHVPRRHAPPPRRRRRRPHAPARRAPCRARAARHRPRPRRAGRRRARVPAGLRRDAPRGRTPPGALRAWPCTCSTATSRPTRRTLPSRWRRPARARSSSPPRLPRRA